MLYDTAYLFLLFFIYSIIGYIFEVTLVTICEKKFTPSRGFLIGPYIPIYGVGVVSIVKLLSKYQNDLLILFVMSTILCTILEYITSVIMEKVFKLRWWDYSHMSFNLNGRVCLLNSIIFGVGGVVIVKLLNPFIEKGLMAITDWLLILLAIIFGLLIIVDLVISIIAMFNIKIEVKLFEKIDATEIVKREIKEFLEKHNFIRKQIDRVLSAFPNAKSTKVLSLPDYKDLVKKIKQEINEAKKELKKKQKELKDKLTKRKQKDKIKP